jgi:hypothetical protein
MSANFLDESLALLSRTPATLDALLRDLPESWTAATEGPGTWSAYVVMGHLAHTEKVDWMPRIMMILEHGASRPFDPVDREAQLGQTTPLAVLLDQFAAQRRDSLARLHALDLQPAQLDLEGMHPTLGPVTLRHLIATWTAHDMAHTVQIARVLAKRYKQDVGPFATFLSVMK